MYTIEKTSAAIDHLEQLRNIVGAPYVFVDEEVLNNYASDETEDLHFLPDVVIKPANAEEISRILKLCNEFRIPVTSRGAGNRPSGGALPNFWCVLLSIQRLNKIIAIDERNLQVI